MTDELAEMKFVELLSTVAIGSKFGHQEFIMDP
jgi:hypothetical protein